MELIQHSQFLEQLICREVRNSVMDQTALIYKLLVVHLTIAEANLTVDRLGIPHAWISDPRQLVDCPLLPPSDALVTDRGFFAGVRTTNFNFSISKDSIIVNQLEGHSGLDNWQDDNGRLGVTRGSVSKEKAYELARGWLERMGVDVEAMEKKQRPQVEHRELPFTNRKTVSSRFSVKWVGAGTGKANRPVAEVDLNASKKWLVRVYITDLAYYRHPLPTIPHGVAINLLPDEPLRKFFHLRPGDSMQKIFKENGNLYTNVFTLLETPPDYESAARKAILTEAEQIRSLLDCDQLDEPKEQNLTDLYVNPPAFGSGSRLEFRNGEMQFDSYGKLRLFRFLPRGQTNYYIWLSTKQSVISSSEAFQIATQKLAALSVDVDHLNNNYKQTFAQGKFYKYDDKHNRIWFLTPEFWLSWGNTTSSVPAIRVAVYGDIKRVGRIELNDNAAWGRSPITVEKGKSFHGN